MAVEYKIAATVTEIYTKLGELIYLLDKNGNEIARVLPCEGRDLSVLREDNDNKKVSEKVR